MRGPLPVLAALALAILLLGREAEGQSCTGCSCNDCTCIGWTCYTDRVPPPRGLTLVRSASLLGNRLTFEWQPPYCEIMENVEVLGSDNYQEGTPLLTLTMDAHRTVYDTSPVFSYEIQTYLAGTDTRIGDPSVLHSQNPCEPRFSAAQWPTVNDWTRQWFKDNMSVRRRVQYTQHIETEYAYHELEFQVRSVLWDGSTWSEGSTHGVERMMTSKTFLKMRVTPTVIAKGSGEEQARLSNVAQGYNYFQISGCSDPLYHGPCWQASWDQRHLKEPITMRIVSGDFLGGADDLIFINWENRNQFLSQTNPKTQVSPDPFSPGAGDFHNAGDLSVNFAKSTDGVAFHASAGDRKLDVYITNYGEQNELLINQREDHEDGFEYRASLFSAESGGDATSSSDNSKAVVTLDCNYNGEEDLFVVNYNQPNKLYVNNGGNSNTFTQQGSNGASAQNYISGQSGKSNGAVAFFCHGDSRWCIYVVNESPELNELWVNNGQSNGGCIFYPVNGGEAASETAGNSTSAVAGDLDGDGYNDLYVTNVGSANQIFLNPGHQNTEQPSGSVAFKQGAAVTGVDSNQVKINEAVRRVSDTEQAIGVDIDGDGDMDLVLADNPWGMKILMNDGTGNFSFMGDGFMKNFAGDNADRPKSGFCYGVVAHNVGHRDGHPALSFAMQHRNYYFRPQSGAGGYAIPPLRTLFQTDTGGDATTTSMNSRFSIAYDLDHDRFTDIYVLNSMEANQILLNDGIGQFRLEQDMGHPLRLGTADKDGRHGIVFKGAPQSSSTCTFIYVANYGQKSQMIVDGCGTTEDDWMVHELSDTFGTSASVFAVAFDMDGDEDMDLLVLNSGEANEVYINQGDGSFAEGTSTGVGAALTSLTRDSTAAAVADFNGDGHIDVFEAYKGTHEPTLFLNDGSGGFQSVNDDFEYFSSFYEWDKDSYDAVPPTVTNCDAVDVDGDGAVDIVVSTGLDVYVMVNDGNARFNITIFTKLYGGSYGEAGVDYGRSTVLDVNNDGAIDIAVIMDGEKKLFFNDGNGNFLMNSFYMPEMISSRTEDSSIHLVAADFDNDGDTDLYASNFGMENELLLNCGKGHSMLPSSKYCAPSPYRPVVESMTPSVGITQGGDIAVVRGRLGSDPNGEVLIGGKACEILTRSSMTTWVCVTPPGIGPAGDVLVSNYGRLSLPPASEGGEEQSLFEYGQPKILWSSPQFISLELQATPSGGIQGGGVEFTVGGENFAPESHLMRARICSYVHFDIDECYECEDVTLFEPNQFTCTLNDAGILGQLKVHKMLVLLGADGDWDNPLNPRTSGTASDSSFNKVCFPETITITQAWQTTTMAVCKCPPGYHDDPVLNTDRCEQCAHNTYSENGAECLPCPVGSTFSTNGGGVGTDVSVCDCNGQSTMDVSAKECKCNPGYQGSPTMGCSPCGQFGYKPYVGNTQCDPCPPGSQTNIEGAISSDSCQCGDNAAMVVISAQAIRCKCKAGFGGDATVASVGCTACGTTSYKGSVGNYLCTSCPPGSSIADGDTDATSSDSCVCGANAEMNTEAGRCECSAGYGGDATVANVGCSACGTSSYKSSVGNTQCTSCPPGSSRAVGETDATSSALCLCSPIAQMNTETGRCECQAGYGGDATNPSVGCTPCGTTAYKSDGGNTQCTSCPAGSSIADGGIYATSSDSCVCGANAEMNTETGRCECAPGYGGDATNPSVGCTPCGTTAYKSDVGNTQCTSCPAGSGIYDGGSVATQNLCVCGLNAEVNTEAGRCECQAGYGGDATSNGCSVCGSTSYKSGVGNTQCTSCPPGASIADGDTDATSSDSCVCGANAEMNTETGRCECSAGYGGDATNAAVGCSACGSTAYKSGVGNTQCTSCPPGASITDGDTDATSSDSCVCGANAEMNTETGRCECSAGFGGDATNAAIGCSVCGTTSYKSDVGNTQCTPCPAGSSIADGDTDATSSDSCVCGVNAEMNTETGRCECSAGFGGDATNPNVGCMPCGTTSYKSDVGNTQCTSCPAGSSIEDGDTDATSSDSCLCGPNAELDTGADRCECVAGHGGDATNPSVGCSACGTTSYKADVGNAPCTSCPAGSSIADGDTDATSSDSCVCGVNSDLNTETGRCECQAGHGGDATNPSVGCMPCGTSSYKSGVGNAQCTACPPGASIVNGGTDATSAESCSCGTNMQMNADTDRCECAAGYGGDATNAAVGCTVCGTTAFKPNVGNTQCTSCPPGASIADGDTDATSSDSCVCGANAEMNTETGRCECSAGYGGDATMASVGCSACGTTAYKSDVGNTQCTSCPAGSSIEDGDTDATSSDSCLCGLNAELNTGTGRCECQAGYGGDATNPNVGCMACGTTSYKSSMGNTQCTSCPAGSSIADGDTDATSSDSCVCGVNAEMNTGIGRCECSAGFGGDATNAGIGCMACGTTSYKSDVGNTQCTSCPAGSSIADGDTDATSSGSCVCGSKAEMNTETGRCECSAGYGGDATVAIVACTPCGSNAHKEDIGNTQCSPCAMGAGIVDGITNATSPDSCACPVRSIINAESHICECLAGHGGDATNANVGCSVCGTTAFKPNVGNTQCTSCPAGSSIADGDTDATSSAACLCGANAEMNTETGRCECSAGYGGDATNSFVGCSPCGSSSFKDTVANMACTPCPQGGTIAGDVSNATSADECLCGVNAVLNAETGRCECSAGYGGDATNSFVGCSPCGSSSFKDTVANMACTPCPQGGTIAGDVSNATSADECLCGVNAVLNAESGRCECDAGYKGDAASTAVGCSACGTREYKTTPGNVGCDSCPLGTTIAGDMTNATSPDSCQCPLNSEMNEDAHVCECGAGFGGDATNDLVGCSPCDSSSFKDTVANMACTPCPQGGTIAGDVSNATSADECMCGVNAVLNAESDRCECEPGYGGDATNSFIGCSACGSQEYKSLAGNMACTPCPQGGTIAGDVSNATSADECMCGVNAVLNAESDRCECEPGHGGDATNSFIGCSACGSQQYKSLAGNMACTPCPQGATVVNGTMNATSADECMCGVNAVLNAESGRCECEPGHGGDATNSFIGCSACGSRSYKSLAGNMACDTCPLGSTIVNGVNATSINECSCDEGTVVVGGGNSTISCQCGLGYFGSNTGDGSCKLCPLGEYKDQAGDAVSCQSCEVAIGEGATTLVQGAKSAQDCECGHGFYKLQGVCTPCEEGAYCPGGDVSSMVALPGYWRSDPISTAFFSCDSPNGYTICMGGNTNQTGDGQSGPLCREGHEGLLCSKCKKGYGKTYGVCSKCDSGFNASSIVLVLFAILVFLALLYVLISNNLRRATSEYKASSITLSVVKIIINWLQMASIAAQVRVSSNESMDRFYQVQDISNVSPFQFSSFNCMVQANYYTQFYATLAVPLVCVVVGFCLTVIQFLTRKAKGVRFLDMFVMVSQMLWFFTYSMVSQIILGIFECRDLDRGISVLSADLAVQCETSKHNSAVKLGYIFGALYIAGLPLQVFAQLYWNRNNLQDRSVKVRYMFLFHNYRKGLYWYECVNMLRKIGLVTALVLLQEDLGTQVFALSILSMTYLTLHAYIKPYSSRTLNELETGALFVTALTLSMCSFFYSNPTGTGNPVVENGLTWSVILLSTALLLWSVLLVGKGGLLAMATRRRKPGGDAFELPSDSSRDYLQDEIEESRRGSPSQFKSLLAHDETEGLDSPSPASEAARVTVMSKPLAQKRGAEPETAQLPEMISKEWLKIRNLVSDSHSKNRESISRMTLVTNPLSQGQRAESDALLPERITSKSTKDSTTSGKSSAYVANPLSQGQSEAGSPSQGLRAESDALLPEKITSKSTKNGTTSGKSSANVANPLSQGQSEAGSPSQPSSLPERITQRPLAIKERPGEGGSSIQRIANPLSSLGMGTGRTGEQQSPSVPDRITKTVSPRASPRSKTPSRVWQNPIGPSGTD